MSERPSSTPATPVLAPEAPVNLDGKGVSGVLVDWDRTRPRGVVAKPQQQVLSELFTSLLVLSATLRYRPVVGAANYLYWMNNEWSLSLVAPDEWSEERRNAFVGTCVLQHDMTWTIALSESLADNGSASDALGRFYDGFVETLDTDLALEDILPFHAERVPYFQRLQGSALSRSLHAAIILGDQGSTSCRQWRMQLPGQEKALLLCGA